MVKVLGLAMCSECLGLVMCGKGLGLAMCGEGLGLAMCGEGLGLAISGGRFRVSRVRERWIYTAIYIYSTKITLLVKS